MATFKPLLGWGRTVVLLGMPGARPGFPYRVGASAQPVGTGRLGRTGDITEGPLRPNRPDRADASSSGTTNTPMSEQ